GHFIVNRRNGAELRGVSQRASVLGDPFMPPIHLSDSELAAVMAAARPLDVQIRDAFLQEIALALASCAEIGPGAVYRAIAAAQRHFFDPPDFERSRTVGKYGR